MLKMGPMKQAIHMKQKLEKYANTTKQQANTHSMCMYLRAHICTVHVTASLSHR